MSFAKAQDLLRLAQMAASRRGGVSLEDICAEFDVSHRTAQRMTEALDATFDNVTTMDDAERRRHWRLETPIPESLQPRQETAIEALEIATRTAHGDGRLRHARSLEYFRDRLLARLDTRDALRSETDAEAVLASLGQVTRPGPKVALMPAVTDAVIEALRGPFRLRVIYGATDAKPREIEPHGMLLGHRSYLVARQPGRSETILNFRMDRIHEAKVLDEASLLPRASPSRTTRHGPLASTRTPNNTVRSCGASPPRRPRAPPNSVFTPLKLSNHKATAV